MIRAGPVGAKQKGDVDWYEKEGTSISQIFVSYNEIIRSIQFGCLVDGSLVLSKQYGSSEGCNFRVVRLSQDEYVTGLSGVLGQIGGEISHLTFHTNREKHGPIGCTENDSSSVSKIEIDMAIRDRREFGGFFGSYNENGISSIGIYVNPLGSSMVVNQVDTPCSIC